ncbi:hypothetical protein FPQ18DRAFT_330284 [Pyronema domesticum]|nr:hypothetical protein FPQ18DRAFT_330284 [Pyronema domesticum]
MSTWFSPLKRALSFDRLPWSGNAPNKNRYSINHPPYPHSPDKSALWLTTSLNPETYENNSLLSPSTATALLSHASTFLLSPADVGGNPGSTGGPGGSGSQQPSSASTTPTPRKLKKSQPFNSANKGYKSQPHSPLTSTPGPHAYPALPRLQQKSQSQPPQLPQLYFQPAEEFAEVQTPQPLELEDVDDEFQDQVEVEIEAKDEIKNEGKDSGGVGTNSKWKEVTPTTTTGFTIRFSLDLNRPETYDDDAELFAFTMEELGGFYVACFEE